MDGQTGGWTDKWMDRHNNQQLYKKGKTPTPPPAPAPSQAPAPEHPPTVPLTVSSQLFYLPHPFVRRSLICIICSFSVSRLLVTNTNPTTLPLLYKHIAGEHFFTTLLQFVQMVLARSSLTQVRIDTLVSLNWLKYQCRSSAQSSVHYATGSPTVFVSLYDGTDMLTHVRCKLRLTFLYMIKIFWFLWANYVH